RLAEVRVPLQARRARSRAGVRRAASAAAGLDDVVPASTIAAPRLVARTVPPGFARKPPGGDAPSRAQPIRRQGAAAKAAGARLSISIHDSAGTRRVGELVAGGVARRISGRSAAPSLSGSCQAKASRMLWTTRRVPPGAAVAEPHGSCNA